MGILDLLGLTGLSTSALGAPGGPPQSPDPMGATYAGLTNAGVGLLSQPGWGPGLGQALSGFSQGSQNYRRNALDEKLIKLRMDEYEATHERLKKEQEAQEAQRKAVQDAIAAGNLDPQHAALAQAFPEKWGQQQFETPKDPTNPFAAYYQDFVATNKRNPTQDEILKFVQAEHPGTNVNIKNEGQIPPGYTLKRDAQGNPVSMEPIAGSPQAKAVANQQQQLQTSGNVVKEDIARAKKLADNWTTGFIGNFTQAIPGTESHNLQEILAGVGSNITIDKLQQMRQNSPTGGALGQVSNYEDQMLRSAYGSLSQSQTKEQFTYNLDRLEKIYDSIINGPAGGAITAFPAAPVMPQAPTILHFDENGNPVQ